MAELCAHTNVRLELLYRRQYRTADCIPERDTQGRRASHRFLPESKKDKGNSANCRRTVNACVSIWGNTGRPFLPGAEPRAMPRSGARPAGVPMCGGMAEGKLTSAPAGVVTLVRANLCVPVLCDIQRWGCRAKIGTTATASRRGAWRI